MIISDNTNNPTTFIFNSYYFIQFIIIFIILFSYGIDSSSLWLIGAMQRSNGEYFNFISLLEEFYIRSDNHLEKWDALLHRLASSITEKETMAYNIKHAEFCFAGEVLVIELQLTLGACKLTAEEETVLATLAAAHVAKHENLKSNTTVLDLMSVAVLFLNGNSGFIVFTALVSYFGLLIFLRSPDTIYEYLLMIISPRGKVLVTKGYNDAGALTKAIEIVSSVLTAVGIPFSTEISDKKATIQITGLGSIGEFRGEYLVQSAIIDVLNAITADYIKPSMAILNLSMIVALLNTLVARYVVFVILVVLGICAGLDYTLVSTLAYPTRDNLFTHLIRLFRASNPLAAFGLLIAIGIPSIQLLIAGFIVDFTDSNGAKMIDSEIVSFYYSRAKSLDLLFITIAILLAFEFRLFPGLAIQIEHVVDIFFLGILATFSIWFRIGLRTGTIFLQIFVYSNITTTEVYLWMLGLLETAAVAFQALTLSNRLTVNILAGGLLIQIVLRLPPVIHYLLVPIAGIVVYEMLVAALQLYIFLLLTSEYDKLCVDIMTIMTCLLSLGEVIALLGEVALHIPLSGVGWYTPVIKACYHVRAKLAEQKDFAAKNPGIARSRRLNKHNSDKFVFINLLPLLFLNMISCGYLTLV